MKTTSELATLLLSLALFISGQSAERPPQPDFSGDWVLVMPEHPDADVATELRVRQPIVTGTVRGEPMPAAYSDLIVERHLGAGTRTDRYRIGVEGGTVGAAAAGARVDTRESVAWIGDSLVIARSRWSTSSGNRTMDEGQTETWQLETESRLVITITRQEGRRESRITLTYRRR